MRKILWVFYLKDYIKACKLEYKKFQNFPLVHMLLLVKIYVHTKNCFSTSLNINNFFDPTIIYTMQVSSDNTGATLGTLWYHSRLFLLLSKYHWKVIFNHLLRGKFCSSSFLALKWSTCSETWNKQIKYFCQLWPPLPAQPAP